VGLLARAALIGLGAYGARAALRVVRDQPRAKELERTNFRGRTLTLAGGPALAVSASVTSALGAGDPRTAAAALAAGLSGGAVGLYDDVVGARPDQKADKGFRGHLRALREGRVTSGLVKIAGVGAGALVAAALLPDRRGRGRLGRAAEVALGAGVIAGSANLMNLLDLRPGRALKAGLLVGAPLTATRAGGLVAGPVGASASLLPADLGEEIMLGDSGANALGALLGVSATARTGLFGRAAMLAGIAALTAASEKVSFTKVIERTPVLREIDAWGRIPAAKPSTAASPSAPPRSAAEPPAAPLPPATGAMATPVTPVHGAEVKPKIAKKSVKAAAPKPASPAAGAPAAADEADHATDVARTDRAADVVRADRAAGEDGADHAMGVTDPAEPGVDKPRPRARAPRRTAS
jgi:UDP-N-acetylmuramyl pentapeptide phosphotransferase/UDP-N-acetylglucosamine-1-phosphate transferase